MSQRRQHVIYLLSLWQAHTKGEPTWRAWLERPSTGERRGFATLDELCNYLKASVSRPEREPDAGPEQPSPAGESEEPGSADEPPTDQSGDLQTLSFPAMSGDQ